MEIAGTTEGKVGSRGVVAFVLCLLCILVRGQGLMALPIFSDEAIYLRWGQLVRAGAGGGGHWWVSLADPKPPLHFWLLAGVIGWTHDPLLAARGLSVAAGVLSIPAILWVCDELGFLVRPRKAPAAGVAPPSGRILGLLAAVLMIFCPFVGFYQRLATADALFVLEMLLVVWLALRWARRIMTGRRAWPGAIALGAALGAAMMTRQGLSYTLWGIPVAGVLLHLPRAFPAKRWLALAAQAALAALVALLLWTPFLTARLAQYTADARTEARAASLPQQNIDAWTIIKQRILYQQQFTTGTASHLAIARRNAAMAFLPPTRLTFSFPLSAKYIRAPAPDRGWFFCYLTWPIYLASLLGLLWLAVGRQWRALALLLVWLALMLGPVIVLGNVVYSRYALAGAVPFLIAAAYLSAELLTRIVSLPLKPVIAWTLAGALCAGLLILPVRDLGRQATAWWTRTFTAADRAQYITGWTNGLATCKAIDFIKGYAAGGNVVVITDNGWGLPADAAWIYLPPIAHVAVYYTSAAATSPLLTPAPSGQPSMYLLRKNKWLYTPAEPVAIPSDASVLFLIGEHSTDDDFALPPAVRRLNPNLKPVLSFYGIDNGPDHVALFEVK